MIDFKGMTLNGGKNIKGLKFEGMEAVVGFGKNDFSMSRGSFRYKEKIEKKQKLILQNRIENSDGSCRLIYVDPTGDHVEEQIHEFELKEHNGRVEMRYSGPKGRKPNRFWLTFPASETEHIYGCGETYSRLDLKGEKVRIWVAEHQNTGRITSKIIREKLTGKHPKRTLRFKKYESYYAQPTFVSSDRYYVHCDVNSYCEFDFSKKDRITLYLQESPVIYTETAESFPELSQKLSALLGRQKTLPDWIYDGAILGIQEGCDTVDMKLEKAEKAGVPVTGVWCQDWSGCRKTQFGYQVMWNWEQDRQLYPNLEEKIKEWNEKGVHFLGYINPFMAIEKDLYQYASEHGYCVKDKDGKDYLVTITTFPAAMVDLTNPKAYEWYKNLIRENMIGIGMSGWMADFGEYLPVDAVLYSKEDPYVIHNRWPAIWAGLNQEAIRECKKEGEVFFFTRAGHTKTIQNSSMMWTGDQHVDWSIDDGIGAVIPATLSLAMSGYGITHSDIGGYTTIMQMRRSRELLMRWEEMNIFSPLYRSHEGNQPVNNVQFDQDDELLKHLARCTKIHVGLKAYLKEAVEEAALQGTPVMRPLFYHYDEEECYTEKTEYLLGRDILAAPVIDEGADQRNVYLPEDEWIHLFSGKEYTQGEVTINAPLGQPPVFIRKSSPWCESIVKVCNIQEETE